MENEPTRPHDMDRFPIGEGGSFFVGWGEGTWVGKSMKTRPYVGDVGGRVTIYEGGAQADRVVEGFVG